MKIIVLHSLAFVAMLVGLGILSGIFHRFDGTVWAVSGLLVTFLIVISGLDYADILRFRKSVARLTKCTVCGRKYKPASSETKVESEIKNVVSGGKNTKEVKTVDASKKEEFLSGLVIRDKLVCKSCIKEIDEMRKVIG